MKSFRYISLSLLPLLFSASLAAQVSDTYVIPIVGSTSGANGTRWSSSLYVFNPQNYSLRVTAVFLPTLGGAGSRVDFPVASNSTAYAGSVLEDLFNRSGTGSLLVATFPELNPGVPNNSLARSFLVTSTTFNNAASGTYGQSVPGIFIGLEDFSGDGISAVAHGIVNRRNSTAGYRTNVGAVNLGRFSAKMFVTVYNATGGTIANRIPFTIPPQGHIQDLLPVDVDRGSLEFFVEDVNRDAVVFPYVSIVDNRSGDPVYQSPTLLAGPGVLYKSLDMVIGRRIDTAIAARIADGAETAGEIVMVSGEGMRLVRR